eukprot:scaffold23986_cov57-Phaeocystis_antarctica.AAC.2
MRGAIAEPSSEAKRKVNTFHDTPCLHPDARAVSAGYLEDALELAARGELAHLGSSIAARGEAGAPAAWRRRCSYALQWRTPTRRSRAAPG